MAEVVWAEPALSDLDAIADHIALDNPDAARRLVRRMQSERLLRTELLSDREQGAGTS